MNQQTIRSLGGDTQRFLGQRRITQGIRAIYIIAGLTIGLLAFAAGEMTHETFVPRSVAQQRGPGMSNRPTEATQREALRNNASLAFSLTGLFMGIALALASGYPLGNARAVMFGGSLGGLAGCLSGATLPLLIVPISFRFESVMEIEPLIFGTLNQALVWSGVVAASSLGVAWTTRATFGNAIRTLVAAILGAVIGVLLSATFGAVLFPLAETDRLLATAWQARLLTCLIIPLCAALAVSISIRCPDQVV